MPDAAIEASRDSLIARQIGAAMPPINAAIKRRLAELLPPVHGDPPIRPVPVRPGGQARPQSRVA